MRCAGTSGATTGAPAAAAATCRQTGRSNSGWELRKELLQETVRLLLRFLVLAARFLLLVARFLKFAYDILYLPAWGTTHGNVASFDLKDWRDFGSFQVEVNQNSEVWYRIL
jgi:hypothetical protein